MPITVKRNIRYQLSEVLTNEQILERLRDLRQETSKGEELTRFIGCLIVTYRKVGRGLYLIGKSKRHETSRADNVLRMVRHQEFVESVRGARAQ